MAAIKEGRFFEVEAKWDLGNQVGN